MICNDCAYEADEVLSGRKTHKWFRDCDNPVGHDACHDLCDCQHKYVTAHSPMLNKTMEAESE